MLAELNQLDPRTHEVITSVDLNKWCPAFIPHGVHSHGNWTSNMVEVLGYMLLPARKQATFAGDFSHTSFLKVAAVYIGCQIVKIKSFLCRIPTANARDHQTPSRTDSERLQKPGDKASTTSPPH